MRGRRGEKRGARVARPPRAAQRAQLTSAGLPCCPTTKRLACGINDGIMECSREKPQQKPLGSTLKMSPKNSLNHFKNSAETPVGKASSTIVASAASPTCGRLPLCFTFSAAFCFLGGSFAASIVGTTFAPLLALLTGRDGDDDIAAAAGDRR